MVALLNPQQPSCIYIYICVCVSVCALACVCVRARARVCVCKHTVNNVTYPGNIELLYEMDIGKYANHSYSSIRIALYTIYIVSR